MMTPKELAILAAKALDEKKGKEISAIEITDITTLADYFVIATGSSNTQINALCGSVEKLLEEQAGEKPLRRGTLPLLLSRFLLGESCRGGEFPFTTSCCEKSRVESPPSV